MNKEAEVIRVYLEAAGAELDVHGRGDPARHTRVLVLASTDGDQLPDVGLACAGDKMTDRRLLARAYTRRARRGRSGNPRLDLASLNDR